jgi:DHA1 family bicyclomycin/chloramphenicol resistance-like MFS transporter
MAVYVAASLVCAFSPHIWLLIVFRFVQGFAASAGIVISRAIARDLYSGHELTKFFSLLMLVSNLGPLVAPIAGSGVLSFTTWIGVFVALAMLGIYLWTTPLIYRYRTQSYDSKYPGYPVTTESRVPRDACAF